MGTFAQGEYHGIIQSVLRPDIWVAVDTSEKSEIYYWNELD